MSSLEGAFTFLEVNGFTGFETEDLDFDMSCVDDGFFQVDGGICEGFLRFALSHGQFAFEVFWLEDEANAFAATAGGGFEEHREAEFLGFFLEVLDVVAGFVEAGNGRDAEFSGAFAGGEFIAHEGDDFGGWGRPM